MQSQNHNLQDEKKEHVIGLHVLNNGAFLKIHNNQKVEIQIGTSEGTARQFIEVIDAPQDQYGLKTTVAELPNNCIALAYGINTLRQNINVLAILDLQSGTCLATQKVDEEIETLSTLPDGSLLLNSEVIVTYKDNQLSMQKDSRFYEYSKNQNKSFSKYAHTLSDLGGQYIPFSDQSDFIYFDNHNQSTIKLITNQFEEKGQQQLGPDYNAMHISFMSLTPNMRSEIVLIQPLNHNYVACVTKGDEKYFAAYGRDDTYRLHIVRTDFSDSYKKTFKHTFPEKLMILNDQYVAVVGRHIKDHTKVIKVFDLKCNMVKKLVIDKKDVFIDVTSDGQIVTCSRTGEMTVHKVLPHSEKELKKEIEGFLTDEVLLPKVLPPIITEYFSSEMPRGGYEEVSYPKNNKFLSMFSSKQKSVHTHNEAPILEWQKQNTVRSESKELQSQPLFFGKSKATPSLIVQLGLDKVINADMKQVHTDFIDSLDHDLTETGRLLIKIYQEIEKNLKAMDKLTYIYEISIDSLSDLQGKINTCIKMLNPENLNHKIWIAKLNAIDEKIIHVMTVITQNQSAEYPKGLSL